MLVTKPIKGLITTANLSLKSTLFRYRPKVDLSL